MMQQIQNRLVESTADGIAAAIAAVVSDGGVEPGDRLPTIRALAAHLGVSASVVAEAWRTLQDHGIITTDRRRGTTVRSTRSGLSGRHWQVPVAPDMIDVDLSTGTPDSDLLPPLGPVLHHLHADVAVTSYVDPPLLVDLESELRRRWPFTPSVVTVVDGALDALDRAVTELVGFGDTVVVEDPTFPPLLDMLELAGAVIIGVPLDSEGPTLGSLTAAMEKSPVAIFTQPRAHNPTGIHISRDRTRAIAALVAGTRTVVVEDDHSGAAAGVAIESIGQYTPDNVLHIHSFSKSHGPDLRIAAMGGTEEVIDRIVRRRQLGPSWTSRLIQQILLTMLTDPETDALVAAAADTYRQRRHDLASRLAAFDIHVAPGVGLNMWIPVSDEQRAVVALAAHSIGAAPGQPFRVNDTGEHHIRVSLGALPTDVDRVAATIASAAAEPERLARR